MKYRKKPIVIEAFQMTKETREDNRDWPRWLHEAWNIEEGIEGALSPLLTLEGELCLTRRLTIQTLEGMQLVGWNDYIIQGIQGEIYPCKPDIFEATYEKVV